MVTTDKMRLLLFSNSTNPGEEYLSYTLPYIKDFLGKEECKAIFVPFAGISVGFDNYLEMVSTNLKQIGLKVRSVHTSDEMTKFIDTAEVIIVGGGNTFHLLSRLQQTGLLQKIREKVLSGTPYIGWSAGSNLACPTIKTTNDMPITEPRDFNALNFIPFQINPHFTDYVQPGHSGETREMRIEEFLIANPGIYVAGLREGTLFRCEGKEIQLIGPYSCKIFKNGMIPVEVKPGDNLDFLMQ
jgi:dipeptidase E